MTTIYAGTACAIFLFCFFRAENRFWGIFLGKIISSHKFWGVILEKKNLRGIDFDQISLTWLKFWIAVTILGYKFLMTCKFWSIVFAKIYKF